MNEELQLKLQAYADGELPEREAREMAELLAKDANARALVAELKHTQSALAVYEAEVKLPESREFFWSKIEREISKIQSPQARVQSPMAAWRRFLFPAGAVAALVLLGLILSPQLRHPSVTASASEFTLADSEAFTYHDYANGTTLVWLSYPAENDFTNTKQADTLD